MDNFDVINPFETLRDVVERVDVSDSAREALNRIENFHANLLARVQELEAENERLREHHYAEVKRLQDENERLRRSVNGWIETARLAEQNKTDREAEIERLRKALKTAEKETHICGPRSMYSEDECPGHRIRQALAEQEPAT